MPGVVAAASILERLVEEAKPFAVERAAEDSAVVADKLAVEPCDLAAELELGLELVLELVFSAMFDIVVEHTFVAVEYKSVVVEYSWDCRILFEEGEQRL